MKQAARQPFACPRRVIDVAAQYFVQIVDLARAVWHPLPRIPTGIKFSRTENGPSALGHRQLCIENRAADFQVRIERLAGNKEPHDFARTFEDCVYAAIAQEPFHRDRWFASAGKRLRSLITPDRKSTRLNSSHTVISYAVFCLKKKKKKKIK